MTTSRDPEIDKLEQELKKRLGTTAPSDPYIEKPQHLAMSDGSSCWLDQNRRCDADCRAYDPGVIPAEGPDVCTLLSSAITMALGFEGFVKAADIHKKTSQDRARVAAAHGVPDPTGKRSGT